MKKKISFKKILKITLWSFVTIGLIVMVAGGLLVWDIIKRAPELDVSKIYGTETTVIYDKDGNVISEFGVQKREWVTYDEISPVMIDAILAVEDSNFFDHPGVDFKRLIVAAFTNLLSGDNQGASTLTQQLIKQTHLTSEKSYERKIQEIYLALQLEKELTKEQILEAYLNFSPFGGRIYGIEKASQYYFGVSASELTLPQAATLAGLVQRPEGYRPDLYADLAEYRRDIVLKLMVRHGFITEELANYTASVPITDLLVCDKGTIDDSEKYQSFIDVVLEELETKYGLDPRSGLEIYTTMDSEAQNFVYDLQHPLLSQNYQIVWPTDMMSGIVFMETQTGEVRAIGGGYKEDEVERSYNFATQLQRQPGSTAKPIFAYGPAIEYLGWGSGTMVEDELYTYQDGSDKIIHNYTNEYIGRITIRDALNRSLNVPAVKAFNAVGAGKVKTFANSIGFSFDGVLKEPTAIGGVSVGFSPLLMAGAYATFGNGGTYNEPVTITKIVKQDGTVIEKEQESHRAMNEETAYILTDMLHTVMTDGTGKTANVDGMYLSGKTGTTNFDAKEVSMYNLPSNAIRDSWFVGYSSQYTAAIWTGYDSNTKGQYITSQTQSLPWHVFNRLMTKFNEAGTKAPARPNTVESYIVEKESGKKDGEVYLASEYTPDNYLTEELFATKNAPTTVSNRFSQLDTPSDFKVEVKDTQLKFTWKHLSNYSLDESTITNQIQTAKKVATNASYLKDISSLPKPTESKLRMMLKQIQTVGQTVYDVLGVDFDGNETLLGTTTDSSLTVTNLTINQLSMFESFRLVARYEKTENGRSLPGEVTFECETCLKPIEVPDMIGWKKERVEEWAEKNHITISFEEVSTLTEETDTVLKVSIEEGEVPTRLLPNQTLIISIAKKELTIPDYSDQNMTVSRYQIWAEDNGLKLSIEEVYHDTFKEGTVISINPKVGTIVKPGDTIILMVSKGKNTTTLPSLDSEDSKQPTDSNSSTSSNESESDKSEDSTNEEVKSENSSEE